MIHGLAIRIEEGGSKVPDHTHTPLKFEKCSFYLEFL